MFSKLREYSYADQKTRTYRRLRTVLWCALLVAVYLLLTNYFFLPKVMKSESMRPGIEVGDYIIFSSFGINHLAAKLFSVDSLPIRRGSIVLVNRAAAGEHGLLLVIGDRLVRFFTAGRVGLSDRVERLFVKRVLALPGDEITLVNYVLRIKPADDPYTFTESELVKDIPDLLIPQANALWDESLPFSGNMDTYVLGENEYFVLSDDRSNTNDSRTWGAVSGVEIAGIALFRYWPLSRMGLPDKFRGVFKK